MSPISWVLVPAIDREPAKGHRPGGREGLNKGGPVWGLRPCFVKATVIPLPPWIMATLPAPEATVWGRGGIHCHS